MYLRLALFLLLAALVVTGAVVLYVRKRRQVRSDRGALFRDVAMLFSDVAVTQDDVDFPVLTGSRAGYRWRLEPVVDAVTYRKLPTLWLCVTCYAELDVPAPVSVLTRPTGNEFFSPNARYRHELSLPDGCSQHARAASPDPAASTAALGPVSELLAEQATKEVWVSPGGVRVVRLIGEAESGPYRVGRRVDLGAPVLGQAELERLCELVVDSVRQHQGVRRGTPQ